MGSGDTARNGKTSGAPGGTRTPNPRIRSAMLYPLSYGRVNVSAQYTLSHGVTTTPGMRRARAYAHSIDQHIGRNSIDIKVSYCLQS